MHSFQRRGLALLFAVVASAPLTAQEAPVDAGPPYSMKVIDLVFKVEGMAGAIEDLRVRETEAEVTIELSADVLFEFDKAELLVKAEATLAKAAGLLREHSSRTGVVRIEGHTDGKGSDAYNDRLSLRRAESVRGWFAAHGFDTERYSVAGLGARRPVAPNSHADGSDDPAGRARNRRVEIKVKK